MLHAIPTNDEELLDLYERARSLLERRDLSDSERTLISALVVAVRGMKCVKNEAAAAAAIDAARRAASPEAIAAIDEVAARAATCAEGAAVLATREPMPIELPFAPHTTVLIDVSLLDPHPLNPRLALSAQVITGLGAMMRVFGFDPNHALVVRRKGERFEVIEGHHRLAAAKDVGLTDVPCTIVEASDADVALRLATANVQAPLSKLEHALHSLRIEELGISVGDYATYCGIGEGNLSRYRAGARVVEALIQAEQIEIRDVTDLSRDMAEHLAAIARVPRDHWAQLVFECVELHLSVARIRERVEEIRGDQAGDPLSRNGETAPSPSTMPSMVAIAAPAIEQPPRPEGRGAEVTAPASEVDPSASRRSLDPGDIAGDADLEKQATVVAAPDTTTAAVQGMTNGRVASARRTIEGAVVRERQAASVPPDAGVGEAKASAKTARAGAPPPVPVQALNEILDRAEKLVASVSAELQDQRVIDKLELLSACLADVRTLLGGDAQRPT